MYAVTSCFTEQIAAGNGVQAFCDAHVECRQRAWTKWYPSSQAQHKLEQLSA